MKLKLHLLRQAEALVAHGSFSRAAEAINLSQSTLSKGIRELESQLGAAVFDRDLTPIGLTDFGRMFMQNAADLLYQASELERLAVSSLSKEAPYLRACFGPYAFETLGRLVVPGYVTTHSKIQLRFESIDPSRGADLLRSRLADIVIAESSSLESCALAMELQPLPGCVVVRAGHPLTLQKNVDMSDVSQYRAAQVTMLPPRVLKPVLLSAKARKGRNGRHSAAPPTIHTSSVAMALDIVQCTDAYTFSTLSGAEDRIKAGVLVPLLQEPWMYAKWSVAVAADLPRPPHLLTFCEHLRRAHDTLQSNELRLQKLWPIRHVKT